MALGMNSASTTLKSESYTMPVVVKATSGLPVLPAQGWADVAKATTSTWVCAW